MAGAGGGGGGGKGGTPPTALHPVAAFQPIMQPSNPYAAMMQTPTPTLGGLSPAGGDPAMMQFFMRMMGR